MPNLRGQVTLNDVTEQQIEFILAFKAKHRGFDFPLNSLQPMPNKPGAYNNCMFSWATEEGMKAAYELTHKLFHGQESTPKLE